MNTFGFYALDHLITWITFFMIYDYVMELHKNPNYITINRSWSFPKKKEVEVSIASYTPRHNTIKQLADVSDVVSNIFRDFDMEAFPVKASLYKMEISIGEKSSFVKMVNRLKFYRGIFDIVNDLKGTHIQVLSVNGDIIKIYSKEPITVYNIMKSKELFVSLEEDVYEYTLHRDWSTHLDLPFQHHPAH